jgi:hypothetical protein
VRPCLLDLVGDIGEVPHRAPQPTGDDESVAFAQDREDLLQLGATVALRAIGLLLENGVHAGALKRRALQGEILIRGRDPGVAKHLSQLVRGGFFCFPVFMAVGLLPPSVSSGYGPGRMSHSRRSADWQAAVVHRTFLDVSLFLMAVPLIGINALARDLQRFPTPLHLP